MRRDLRADWSTKLMGDVSSLKGRLGWQGLKAAHYQPSGPYVVSSAHFDRERIDWDLCPHVTQDRYERDQSIQLRTGDILLMKDGAALGKIAYVDELPGPACLNSHLLLFRPIEDSYDPKFVYYCLGATEFQKYIKTHANGLTFLGISQESVSRFPLRLPAIAEQRRIAEVLGTVDEAIRKTEQIVAKLKQVKQGLLHDLLTRGIDDSGELRDPLRHPEEFKDSIVGRIPTSWAVHPFMDLVSLPSGQIDPRVEPYRSWVLVAPDHVESSSGRLLAKQTAADQGAISGKYGFSPGDVVYSKIRPYLRKAILADFEGLCSADMYPLRPRELVSSRYLLALILGEEFSRFAEGVSMRSGFPKINRAELAEYRAKLPPRAEQDAIANAIEAHERRQESEVATLGKLLMLKRGMTDDLLTGRIRVTSNRIASRRSDSPQGQLGLDL